MIELAEYDSRYEEETLKRMADFFGFHRSLYDGFDGSNPEVSRVTIETLERWISEDHALYVILHGGESAGFIHIGYRGGNVAWIEDIYVDKQRRGKGIASRAVRLAEEIIARDKDYDAVCVDICPRNTDSMKLAFSLGYINLSMITVRKELYGSGKDREVSFLGLDYKY
ncbi:MAG: GNAT family N-acetyltransferase [Oscillospiraceae bacterium]|nr:GNAT family N-acetyltransferase [Oscillospiraceae bacterium]